MKNRKKRIILITLTVVVLFLMNTRLFAQVKIGQNPALVNPNAALEIESTNKGFLLPRVNLVAPHSATPLTAFVKGMLVFNNTNNDSVFVGIYYSDGAQWIKVPAAASGTAGGDSAWSLYGNSGINPAAQFLGTKDYTPLAFRTNNSERFRIAANGWVGIGTANPLAALHIKGQLVIDTLLSGNVATDQILVANPADGRVKTIPVSSVTGSVQKKTELVATQGQTLFTTPATITDSNKVMLYRNGVMISFTVSSSNTINAEVSCDTGDEIRIVQFF